jgi:hypothetical protein
MFGSDQVFFSGVSGFYNKSIDQSLRFNDDDNAHLDKTLGSPTNNKIFTLSVWVKRANLGTPQMILSASSGTVSYLQFQTDDTMKIRGSGNLEYETVMKFRDVGSWYHIVFTYDSAQSTDTDRARLYVNGTEVTDFSPYTKAGINEAIILNSAVKHSIGTYSFNDTSDFDGYLAEMYFVDGTALTPSTFGEIKNDIWIPKETSISTSSFGNNGFHLAFADSSDIGNDTSGKGNDFTPDGFQPSDVVSDSPTENYAVMNALDGGGTLSNGNLDVATDIGATRRSNFGMSTGKWYFEFNVNSNNWNIGLTSGTDSGERLSSGTQNTILFYFGRGSTTNSGGTESAPQSTKSYDNHTPNVTTGTYGFALDLDAANPKCDVYYNGTLAYTFDTFTVDPPYFFGVDRWNGSPTTAHHVNFGQESFLQSVPTGYKACNTANLPNLAIDPAEGETPDQYFNTVLWTGNQTARSITGVGFSPDWVWIKNKDFAKWHHLYDSVRGSGKVVYSNENNQQTTGQTDHLTSFDSDGFSLGDHENVNKTGDVNVAWNWKAGTSFSFSGETNTIDSSGSTSAKSGFSIVTYTHDATKERVKHNLGAIPEIIMVKDLTVANAWAVYHQGLTENYFLELHEAYAQALGSNPRFLPRISPVISTTSIPTDTYFFVRSGYTANASGSSYIAYCFKSVEGYSKVGVYEGNNDLDNAFVFTGFRPAWIMIKNMGATGNWGIWDTKRNVDNVAVEILRADTPDDKSTTTPNNEIDIVSNGFKVRGNTGISGDATTYIYLAFAEQPFKYANAR